MREFFLWDEAAAPRCDIRFLGDDSLPGDFVEGLFDRDRVVEGLYAAVHSALMDNFRTWKLPVRVFALYGRFGQGKTGVIREIEQRLQGKRIDLARASRGFRLTRIRVGRFDVSHRQEKDLLKDFDLYLAQPNLLWNSLFAIMGTILIAGVLSLGAEWLKSIGVISDAKFRAHTWALSIGLGLLSFLVLPDVRLFFTECLRALRVGDWVELGSRIRTFLNGRPDVVLIDDFDRASIEQQEAMLWGLRRWRRTMRGVVIIAFDEGALLNPKQDGDLKSDKADELLVKTFDVAFSLAPMNDGDAVDMALAFTKDLLTLNAEGQAHVQALRMQDAQFVSDLARVYALHGQASARFAKRLLNRVFNQAVQSSARDVAELSAILRVQGIFQYVPALQTDYEFMVEHLQMMAEEALPDAIQLRLPDELKAYKKDQLKRFLCSTRHMRPTDGHWDRIFRLDREVGTSDIGGRADQTSNPLSESPELVRRWCLWDLWLLSRRTPVERESAYDNMIEAAESGARPPHSVPSSEPRPVPTSSQAQDWKRLANRLRIFDPEHLESLLATRDLPNLDELFFGSTGRDAHWGDLLGFAMRRDGLTDRSIASRTAIVKAALASRIAVSQRNVAANFRRAVSSAGCGLADVPFSPSSGAYLGIDSIVQTAWPAFDNPALGLWNADVEENFDELGRVQALFPVATPVVPNAHRQWFRRALRHPDADAAGKAMVEALKAMLPPDFANPVTDKVWCGEAIRQLLVDDDSRRKVCLAIGTRLDSTAGSRREVYLWLGCVLGDPAIVDRTLDAFPPRRACAGHGWLDALKTRAADSAGSAWATTYADRLPDWLLTMSTEEREKVEIFI